MSTTPDYDTILAHPACPGNMLFTHRGDASAAPDVPSERRRGRDRARDGVPTEPTRRGGPQP